MTNLERIPAQDNFETTLSSPLAGDTAVLTFTTQAVPSYLPDTTKTRVIINPGKDNAELVNVDEYDSATNTWTIPAGGRAQPLKEGVSASVQAHASGSKVIISDNFQFWDDIKDAIASKADQLGLTADVYATAAARDAAITAPTNGMQVYLTDGGKFTDYIAGAWVDRAAGGVFPNADETTAGKVEEATLAEAKAGTNTGVTGAQLFATPGDIASAVQDSSWTFASDGEASDAYAITLTPAVTAYVTGQRFTFIANTANTGAATLNVNALGAKNIKKNNDSDLVTGDIESGQVVEVVYDGTNFQMVTPSAKNSVLTGGEASNADALHTHANLGVYSGTAGEAIDGSATPQALCAIGSAFKDVILVSESGFGFSHEINFDWNSVPAGGTIGDVDTNARIAQAFTYVNADATITLESVSFFVKKNGTPADNIRVTIQTDTGGSIPDNTVIANGTSNNVSGGSLSTNYELTTFTFSTPPTLTYNQKYYFVFERTGALDAANYYIVGNANADRYSGHNVAKQTGSTATWASVSNNDYMFIARFNVDGSNQIFKGEADNGVRCNYVGVTEDNVAADAAISVTPPGGVNSSFAGLAGCAEYYLSATAGAIAASAPSSAGAAVIPVGTTRSATTLEIAKGSRVYKVGLSNFVPEDAGNFDLYIPCGFKPKVVEVLWFLSDSGGGSNYDVTHAKFLTTYGSDPTASLFKQLTSAGVITGGTSTINAGGSGSGGGSGDQTTVYPVSTFDNGVVIKFKNATTEFITQCDILLYG